MGNAYCQEGTTKHPYEHKHTHAIRREHLMCLLSVRLIILVVLLHETTALNAIIQIAYSATQDKNTKKIRFDKEKMKICNIVEISFEVVS